MARLPVTKSQRGFTFLRSKKANPLLKLSSSGFTLIEILIAVGIFTVLLALAIATYSTLNRQIDLDTTTQGILSNLRLARTQTLGSEGESNYGVHFETDKYVFFKGTTYDSASADNKVYDLTSSEIYLISLTGGGSDVVFDRIRGTTANSGSVSVRLINDNSRVQTITIDSGGQFSLQKTVNPTGTRTTDHRHLHFDLGWSIQNSNTLTLAFQGGTPVTQNITMAPHFNAGKTDFNWSGKVSVDGADQVLSVNTHSLDGFNTVLSINHDRRYNNKALTISIDGNQIVSYTAGGVATVGASGGTMSVQ